MSLWKPYVEDVALDLSRPRAQEAPNEFPVYHPPQVPANPENFPTQLPVPEYLPYGSIYGASLALVQISPGSSSGYASVPGASITPCNIALSPPKSPIGALLCDNPDFRAFEEKALKEMAARNGGVLVGSNPRMRRSVRASAAAPADAAYQSQRERNNKAAKQSRDRRKLREIRLGLQVTYLKKEVALLEAALREKSCIGCNQPCVH